MIVNIFNSIIDPTRSGRVKIDQFHRFLLRFGPICEPSTGREFLLERFICLISNDWFHPNDNETTSKAVLESFPDSFLVRLSSNEGKFVLCFNSEQSVRIINNPKVGTLSLESAKESKKRNMKEEYLSVNSLVDAFFGDDRPLPCPPFEIQHLFNIQSHELLESGNISIDD